MRWPVLVDHYKYGWTLLPCCLLDELQKRLHWAFQTLGDELEAITARLSWEWLPNNALLGSVNELNLYGLSRLIRAPSVSPQTLFTEWLAAYALHPLSQQEIDDLFATYTSSRDWMCKTPSLLRRLLQRHSRPPHDFEQGAATAAYGYPQRQLVSVFSVADTTG